MSISNFLLTGFCLVGVLFLSACGQREEVPPASSATGAITWSPEEAKRIIAERDSHAAKATSLEEQLRAVRELMGKLELEETRIKNELKEEKLAAARVRIYWWLSICAILAGACVVASFIFPSVGVWTRRGAIGFGFLAAILGIVAMLISWWAWIGAGLLVIFMLWWAIEHAKSTSTALAETVEGVEQLKPILGSTYKSVLKKVQSDKTIGIIDALRNRFKV